MLACIFDCSGHSSVLSYPHDTRLPGVASESCNSAWVWTLLQCTGRFGSHGEAHAAEPPRTSFRHQSAHKDNDTEADENGSVHGYLEQKRWRWCLATVHGLAASDAQE